MKNILEYDHEMEGLRQNKAAAKEQLMTEPVDPAKDLPELAFLKFSRRFDLMSDSHLENTGLKEKYEKLFPGLKQVWRHKEKDVFILAGKTPLIRDRVLGLSETELNDIMKRVGISHNSYYLNMYQSQASFKIRTKESLKSLSVVSKYLQDTIWRTDRRYFYFFKPDYRFNLMITGPDKDLISLEAELGKVITTFETLIIKTYPHGIFYDEKKEKS